MKQAVTRALYNHWNELRGSRAAPDRAEIEPAAIRELLKDTFILETGQDKRFAFRLAGARLTDLFLNELHGVSFVSLFRMEDRDSVRALLEAVTDDPAPLVAGVRAGPPGRKTMDLELLLLPLGPRGTANERVIGSMTPATLESWLGLIACEPLRLTSLRILHPAAATPAGRYPLDAAFWSTLHLADHQKGEKAPLRKANLTLYNG